MSQRHSMLPLYISHEPSSFFHFAWECDYRITTPNGEPPQGLNIRLPEPSLSIRNEPALSIRHQLAHRPILSESSEDTLVERETDAKLITWSGPEDPQRPINWSARQRWLISTAMMFFSFVNTFTSSVWSPGVPQAASHFQASEELLRLGVSLFVLGSCAGPLIWAPCSELFGRTRPLFIGMTLSTLFNIPVAVAPNVTAILICRFLGGVFGCAGLTIAPAVIVDISSPRERGLSVVLLVACMLIAPCLGPIFGSLVVHHSTWRWSAWLAFVVEVVALIFGLGVMRETSEEILLKRRRKHIDPLNRPRSTSLSSKADHATSRLFQLMHNYVVKPPIMMIQEPIVSIDFV